MARKAKKNDEAIFVKVARTGGVVNEYCLDDEDKTVEAILDVADMDVDDEEKIRVNGKLADMDTELKDGDVVTISGKVKGGI